mmetsp:Transcript_41781/g.124998  ORF Transcript_41781/g.124998 Transcript_41781/m.124998 type:complete len:206 (+) Transcript_41781:1923-2540(+)
MLSSGHRPHHPLLQRQHAQAAQSGPAGEQQHHRPIQSERWTVCWPALALNLTRLFYLELFALPEHQPCLSALQVRQWQHLANQQQEQHQHQRPQSLRVQVLWQQPQCLTQQRKFQQSFQQQAQKVLPPVQCHPPGLLSQMTGQRLALPPQTAPGHHTEGCRRAPTASAGLQPDRRGLSPSCAPRGVPEAASSCSSESCALRLWHV